MSHRRTITFLTWMVIVLGVVASGIGLFSGKELRKGEPSNLHIHPGRTD